MDNRIREILHTVDYLIQCIHRIEGSVLHVSGLVKEFMSDVIVTGYYSWALLTGLCSSDRAWRSTAAIAAANLGVYWGVYRRFYSAVLYAHLGLPGYVVYVIVHWAVHLAVCLAFSAVRAVLRMFTPPRQNAPQEDAAELVRKAAATPLPEDGEPTNTAPNATRPMTRSMSKKNKKL